MCVLGAFNERYEALCNVRMYVCMCLKGNFNHGQMVQTFFFIYYTGWVNVVFGILNLEGLQNCMIGSKVPTMLPPFFI